jgi:hypothetical protein
MKGIEEGDNVCFISFTLFVSAAHFLAVHADPSINEAGHVAYASPVA